MDYFKEEEFACKCGCGLNNVTQRVKEKVVKLRDVIGCAVVITSGSRCIQHNKKVGGHINSGHLSGLALDIYSPYLSTSILWVYLESLGLHGMFHYVDTSPRIIHIDMKSRFARGVFRAGKYTSIF